MLGIRLREILTARNISVNDFANMCDLPLETVKNIYYGRTTDPKVSTLLIMSEVLGITINCLMGRCSHTKEERSLLNYYRLCGNHGKSLILLTAKYEATSAKSERESVDNHKIPCLVPSGNIHHGIVYDCCEVVDITTVIKEAYVGIKMINNDLIPVYCKGDIILIENRFPNPGEYGVFYLGNRAYIRKFVEENNQYRLKCLHHYGEDIILKRLDSIEYIGTCIDVVRG